MTAIVIGLGIAFCYALGYCAGLYVTRGTLVRLGYCRCCYKLVRTQGSSRLRAYRYARRCPSPREAE